jgi:hypothetical protein
MSQAGSVDRRIRDALLPITAMFVASRLTMLLIAYLTATQIEPSIQASDQSSLFYLCRFDCGKYLSIAQHGYSTAESAGQPGATNFAFYPLFPLLVRIIAPVFGGSFFFAAVTLTNLCFYAALAYVYKYARLVNLGHRTALLAVGLLCVMPQSIAFSAVYSESPFLLLLVVAMYYLRGESYLIAGIAAALLSATRANGVFFAVFAVAWIIQCDGVHPFLKPWQRPEKFIPIVFAPFGMFVFLTYCFVTTGDAFAHPSTELYGWGWYFAPPWENLLVMLRTDGVVRLAALSGIGFFLCCLLLLRRKLYAEFAFCIALVLLIWSGQGTASVFRYWLVLFPVWIALARELEQKPLLSAMVFSVFAMLNGLMVVAWILQKSIAI